MTSDAGPTSRLRLTLAIACAVIVIDQITKHWAVNTLTGVPPKPVFWTLQWNLTFNSGMAFSKGEGMGAIIGVIALVVVVVILSGMRKNTNRVVAVAAGFVVGGAIGNLVDRLFRDDGWLQGSVVDFIDFQWFPIFNVADMGVNIGGVLFVLWSLFSSHEHPDDHPADEAGDEAVSPSDSDSAAGNVAGEVSS
ncbi:MAG: signal peptidase II [Actinomycetota bacterium]|nr:signal peptidase II [Actinomycetota bacterium]